MKKVAIIPFLFLFAIICFIACNKDKSLSPAGKPSADTAMLSHNAGDTLRNNKDSITTVNHNGSDTSINHGGTDTVRYGNGSIVGDTITTHTRKDTVGNNNGGNISDTIIIRPVTDSAGSRRLTSSSTSYAAPVIWNVIKIANDYASYDSASKQVGSTYVLESYTVKKKSTGSLASPTMEQSNNTHTKSRYSAIA